jgi:hypothetical protein
MEAFDICRWGLKVWDGDYSKEVSCWDIEANSRKDRLECEGLPRYNEEKWVFNEETRWVGKKHQSRFKSERKLSWLEKENLLSGNTFINSLFIRIWIWHSTIQRQWHL